MLEDVFKGESISTTLSAYNGQSAAFLDNELAAYYYPELNQLFFVFPDMKKHVLKSDNNYYSSQNFSGEN
jgi:hypothetical protein